MGLWEVTQTESGNRVGYALVGCHVGVGCPGPTRVRSTPIRIPAGRRCRSLPVHGSSRQGDVVGADS